MRHSGTEGIGRHRYEPPRNKFTLKKYSLTERAIEKIRGRKSSSNKRRWGGGQEELYANKRTKKTGRGKGGHQATTKKCRAE